MSDALAHYEVVIGLEADRLVLVGESEETGSFDWLFEVD